MRVAILSGCWLWVMFAGACEAPRCSDDENCPPEAPFCGSSGFCTVNAPTAEGEGELAEGEGETGEGEGGEPVGEGEGEGEEAAGEGEGEEPAGEGEGEEPAGEGEGEGEGEGTGGEGEGEGEGASNNQPPIAAPDAVDAIRGVTTRFAVLGNDSDPDGDALTTVDVTASRLGTVSIVGDEIAYLASAPALGAETLRYTISDGRGGTASADLVVTIVVLPPAIATNALATAERNAAYEQLLAADGGTAPYLWSLSDESPALPLGLTLDPDGRINGTPTVSGTFEVGLTVTDEDGESDSRAFTLTVLDDVTAPAATTLQVRFGGGRDHVELSFVAPGDDGNAGTATAFSLRRLRVPVTGANFDVAEDVEIGPVVLGGTSVRRAIALPWSDGVWHLAFRAVDESGNTGPVSASLTVDTSPKLQVITATTTFAAAPFHTFATAPAQSLSFTLLNAANALADLTISDAALEDAFQSFTLRAGAVPIVLAPGTSRTVSIDFAPRVPGALSADLELVHDDDHADAVSTVRWTGAGVNLPPQIASSATQLVRRATASDVSVRVIDENGALDVASVVADLRAVGGGAAVSLVASTAIDETTQLFSATLNTTTAATGIASAQVSVVDDAGATASGSHEMLVFAGNALEVGAGQAFTELKPAVAAAVAGDLVVVHAGTYRGNNNKNTSIAGKDITIFGLDGPDNTTIDCENAGRAFSVGAGSTLALTISGLTMKRCPAAAVQILGVTALTLSDVAFEANVNADRGGAVRVDGTQANVVIRRAAFRNNSALAGAAVAALNNASVTIEDASFVSNFATDGGKAVDAPGTSSSVTLRRVSIVTDRHQDIGRGHVELGGPFLVEDSEIIGGNIGLRAFGSSLGTLRNTRLENNNVAISVADSARATVDRCSIVANVQALRSRLLTVTDSLFEANENLGTIEAGTFERCDFVDNIGPNAALRAIDCSFVDCRFEGNVLDDHGLRVPKQHVASVGRWSKSGWRRVGHRCDHRSLRLHWKSR